MNDDEDYGIEEQILEEKIFFISVKFYIQFCVSVECENHL